MAKEFTVKYQYALNSKDEIQNINALSKTDEIRREIYRCISCGNSLRPVLGEVRKKHFRHVVEANCNPETYLHQLAKRLFFHVYTDCLEKGSPFNIELYENWVCTSCKDEFEITCELDPKLIKFDLVKLFPNISIETPDGSFIPDILLSNGNGEKLFIEFVVTHVSSEEKRNSGARIIELSLEDEEDLEPIQQKLITQTYFKAEFLNFKKIVKTRCSFPSCNNKLFFFLLKTDGGAYVLNDTPKKYKLRLEKGDIEFSKVLPHGGPQIYIDELENAYHAKKKIRNCFLCRYHGENIFRDDDEGPIYCKFLKQKYVSTRAVSCEYYRADPKAFPSQNLDIHWL
ncbi:competence protein CoiA family protein [Levilinea saccharolytica]|uniref:hypothetical protein n=1 Tax=Levilinea saccharolytica TaxID=229921 RepID=UPI0011BD4588|nr:hypothetical protein [Levilinea saccharolytica]GAP18926.1 competence protein [Levilinea saccharolytica]